MSLTTFRAYLVPSRSSVNCMHFLPLILTNENPENKIRSLGIFCLWPKVTRPYLVLSNQAAGLQGRNLTEVCTHDRDQFSPIQIDQLIRCLLYGQTRKLQFAESHLRIGMNFGQERVELTDGYAFNFSSFFFFFFFDQQNFLQVFKSLLVLY